MKRFIFLALFFIAVATQAQRLDLLPPAQTPVGLTGKYGIMFYETFPGSGIFQASAEKVKYTDLFAPLLYKGDSSLLYTSRYAWQRYKDSIASVIANLQAAPAGPQGPAGPTGPQGSAGQNIELQTDGGFIQWRVAGTSTWANLVSLASITGPQGTAGATGSTGTAGTNGKSVELQVSGGFIQWRLTGDVAWNNLLATSTLVGATGAQGPAGPAGSTGAKGDKGDVTVVQYALYPFDFAGENPGSGLPVGDSNNRLRINPAAMGTWLMNALTSLPGYAANANRWLNTDFTWKDAPAAGSALVQLSAPTLTYGSLTSSGAVLSWSPSQDAGAYVLQRATDINFTQGLATAYSGVSNTYTETALSGNTSYYYRVKATATGFTDSYFGTTAFSTLIPTPAAPTSPVTDATNRTFGWTYSVTAGYTSPSQYEISENSGSTYTTCTANPQPIASTAALAIGVVKLRVKATANNYQSATIQNAVAFPAVTGPTAPVVTTGSASGIAQTVATVAGTISSNGGASVTEYGIEYSITSGFTGGTGTKVTSANLSGTAYTSALSGLTASTTYYARAYAVNSVGTTYGSIVSFSTLAPVVIPTVSTGSSSGVTTSGATVAGTISSAGNANISEYGIEWSTTSGFANGTGTKVTSSNLSGSAYTAVISGLSTSTTYYVHAYAVNSAGTGYGSAVSFTTAAAATAPVVSTGSATNVATTTATLGGVLTSNGGATVSEYGVEYSTTSGFTGGTGTKITSSNLSGTAFSAAVSSLSSSTTYYFRAYAVNSVGTTYGSAVSFSTTTPVSLPTVSTGAASSITGSTATVAGTISSNGGGTITAYGIEYSTTSGFTGGTGTKVASSNISGTDYSSALSGLTTSTTYYVRAYATNSAGTAYGSAVSFATTNGGVASYTVEKSIRLNFSNQFANYTSASPTKWNQLMPTTAALTGSPYYSISNLVDETNTASGMGLAVTAAWNAGVGTNTTTPTDGTGRYANAVITSGWQVQAQTGAFKLTGLLSGKVYQLYLYVQAGANASSGTITVNGVSKSYSYAASTYGTPSGDEYQDGMWQVINNVAPDANGEIAVTLVRTGGFFQANLSCAIVRQSVLN